MVYPDSTSRKGTDPDHDLAPSTPFSPCALHSAGRRAHGVAQGGALASQTLLPLIWVLGKGS